MHTRTIRATLPPVERIEISLSAQEARHLIDMCPQSGGPIGIFGRRALREFADCLAAALNAVGEPK